METYTPVRGMIICQNDTGDYVSKADFDAMREERNEAWGKRNSAFEDVERLQEELKGWEKWDSEEVKRLKEILEDKAEASPLFDPAIESFHKELRAALGVVDGESMLEKIGALREERDKARERVRVLEATEEGDEATWDEYGKLLALADALCQSVEECEQDRKTAQLSGLETGWEHPGTHVSFRKILAHATAYREGEKPERCECGADRKACEENRAARGVHLESGCGN